MTEETIVFEESAGTGGGRFSSLMKKFVIVTCFLWGGFVLAVSSGFVHEKLQQLIERHWKGTSVLGDISVSFPLTVNVSSIALKNVSGEKDWIVIDDVEVGPSWLSLLWRPLDIQVGMVRFQCEMKDDGTILPFHTCSIHDSMGGSSGSFQNLVCYGNSASFRESDFYTLVAWNLVDDFTVDDGTISLDWFIKDNGKVAITWETFNLRFTGADDGGGMRVDFNASSLATGKLNCTATAKASEESRTVLWSTRVESDSFEFSSLPLVLKSDLIHLLTGSQGTLRTVFTARGHEVVPEEVTGTLKFNNVQVPLPLGAVEADSATVTTVVDFNKGKGIIDIKVSNFNNSAEKISFVSSMDLASRGVNFSQLQLKVDKAAVYGTGSLSIPQKSGQFPDFEFYLKGTNIPLPPADVEDTKRPGEWTVVENTSIEEFGALVTGSAVHVNSLTYVSESGKKAYSGVLVHQMGGVYDGTLVQKNGSGSTIRLCGFLWSPSVTLRK